MALYSSALNRYVYLGWAITSRLTQVCHCGGEKGHVLQWNKTLAPLQNDSSSPMHSCMSMYDSCSPSCDHAEKGRRCFVMDHVACFIVKYLCCPRAQGATNAGIQGDERRQFVMEQAVCYIRKHLHCPYAYSSCECVEGWPMLTWECRGEELLAMELAAFSIWKCLHCAKAPCVRSCDLAKRQSTLPQVGVLGFLWSNSPSQGPSYHPNISPKVVSYWEPAGWEICPFLQNS